MSDDVFSEAALTDWWTQFKELCHECRAEAITYDVNNFDVQIKVEGHYFNLTPMARKWLEHHLQASRNYKKTIDRECQEFRPCEGGPEHDCERESSWEVVKCLQAPEYYCDRHLCDGCRTSSKPVTVRKWPHE